MATSNEVIRVEHVVKEFEGGIKALDDCSLTVNRGREDYLRISIDTENYRAKREEALRKLAVRMAGRAKKSGKRVALEPMNPYERRILHSALQNDPEVTTHSEGEEPYRRVIITLNR